PQNADERDFMKNLKIFMRKRGSPIEKIPALGFRKINLFKMYEVTQALGGYDQVTDKRLWRRVYSEVGGAPSITSAATNSRRHYEKLLLPFERCSRGEEYLLDVKRSETPSPTPDDLVAPQKDQNGNVVSQNEAIILSTSQQEKLSQPLVTIQKVQSKPSIPILSHVIQPYQQDTRVKAAVTGVMSQQDTRLKTAVSGVMSQQNTRLKTAVTGVMSQQDTRTKAAVTGVMSQQDTRLKTAVTGVMSQQNTRLKTAVTGVMSQQDTRTKAVVTGVMSQQDTRLKAAVTGVTSQQDTRLKTAVTGVTSQQDTRLKAAVTGVISQQGTRLKAAVTGVMSQDDTRLNAAMTGVMSQQGTRLKAAVTGVMSQDDTRLNAAMTGVMSQQGTRLKAAVTGVMSQDDTRLNAAMTGVMSQQGTRLKTAVTGVMSQQDTRLKAAITGVMSQQDNRLKTAVTGVTSQPNELFKSAVSRGASLCQQNMSNPARVIAQEDRHNAFVTSMKAQNKGSTTIASHLDRTSHPLVHNIEHTHYTQPTSLSYQSQQDRRSVVYSNTQHQYNKAADRDSPVEFITTGSRSSPIMLCSSNSNKLSARYPTFDPQSIRYSARPGGFTGTGSSERVNTPDSLRGNRNEDYPVIRTEDYPAIYARQHKTESRKSEFESKPKYLSRFDHVNDFSMPHDYHAEESHDMRKHARGTGDEILLTNIIPGKRAHSPHDVIYSLPVFQPSHYPHGGYELYDLPSTTFPVRASSRIFMPPHQVFPGPSHPAFSPYAPHIIATIGTDPSTLYQLPMPGYYPQELAYPMDTGVQILHS
ncbi:AT-rich interactive domain-containing 5A-like isoform X2, partial [Paramuricea clavata]